MTTEAPLRFGPYELVDRIAMGGMAEVFLARREGARGFQKLVAVDRVAQIVFVSDALFAQ